MLLVHMLISTEAKDDAPVVTVTVAAGDQENFKKWVSFEMYMGMVLKHLKPDLLASSMIHQVDSTR